jgi:hypothetical protein
MSREKLSRSTTDGAPGGEEDFRPYPAGKALTRRTTTAPAVDVEPERLGDVLWSVLALYVALVGAPVVAGVWAGVVLWHRVRHG